MPSPHVPAAGTPTVSVRGVSKAFHGVSALSGVDLDLRPGEVHGLLGHNGSGKSTLIKVLAGYHEPDAGEVRVLGVPLAERGGPGSSGALRFVHQDLGLIPTLSVLDNLLVRDLAGRRHGRIRWRTERRRAQELLDAFDVDIPITVDVAELSPLDKARLAIVRAFTRSEGEEAPRLIVLDEPTVFLPRAAVTDLFGLVRTVVQQGATVLFVSHQLEEVLELTDRVTVLREGAVVACVETRATAADQLVELIVGRALAPAVLPSSTGSSSTGSSSMPAAKGRGTVTVRELGGGMCTDASWSVPVGSVVGLAGVVGSGADDVPALLFGARQGRGTLVLDGDEIDVAALDATGACRRGIALVPADRLSAGSYPDLPVVDNVLSQQLRGHFRGGRLRWRGMKDVASAVLHEFGVRPPDPGLRFDALSGGNQQKVMLARWLTLRPRLLLLHEPTQGVDIAARQDIFRLIREAAAGGVTTFVASADLAQLAEICDVVLVFSRGRVQTVLTGADITDENILQQVAQADSLSTHELDPEAVPA